MIFLQHPGVFGSRADGAFTTGADALSAADALIDDADGLFVFNTDGLGGTDPQTSAIAGAAVLVKTDKAGRCLIPLQSVFPPSGRKKVMRTRVP